MAGKSRAELLNELDSILGARGLHRSDVSSGNNADQMSATLAQLLPSPDYQPLARSMVQAALIQTGEAPLCRSAMPVLPTWQAVLAGSLLTPEEQATVYAQLEDDAPKQSKLVEFATKPDTSPARSQHTFEASSESLQPQQQVKTKGKRDGERVTNAPCCRQSLPSSSR